MNTITKTANSSAIGALIEHRQNDLGVSDQEVAGALGYSEAAWGLIKSGAMRVPVAKVSELARVLSIDTVALLQAVLKENVPGLWEVLEPLLPLGVITPTEANLIRYVRKASGGRAAAPMVLDGASVVAVVVTP